MNQTHPIQNSHFILLIQTFVLSSNQYQAAKVSTTRIYAGRSGVQISAGAIELSFLQKTRLPPVPTLPPNQWNPELISGSNVASADSLTTHIWLEPSLKISGAIPPRNLSPSTAHSGTSFYSNHLPLYISLNRSHPFWSYKGTFLYITSPLHSHYMKHLFHFTPTKMKGMFDLLMDETFHCKRHFTCSEYQNKGFFS